MRETIIVYAAVAIDLVLILAVTAAFSWSLGGRPSFENFISTVAVVAFIRTQRLHRLHKSIGETK